MTEAKVEQILSKFMGISTRSNKIELLDMKSIANISTEKPEGRTKKKMKKMDCIVFYGDRLAFIQFT